MALTPPGQEALSKGPPRETDPQAGKTTDGHKHRVLGFVGPQMRSVSPGPREGRGTFRDVKINEVGTFRTPFPSSLVRK